MSEPELSPSFERFDQSSDHDELEPHIIGIGASAGGLEALRAFLSAFPKRSDAGLIIVQHGGDLQKPLLPDLLRAVTDMPVTVIEDEQKIEGGRVHVVKPNTATTLRARAFAVRPASNRTRHLERRPIDHLFQSIALSAKDRAVGIVLSGEGADGTAGLQAITKAGGLTLAQTPAAASHEPMPANAMASGVVDHAGAPAELASRLVAYLDHAKGSQQARARIDKEAVEKSIREICEILRERTGHDFLHYKLSTLLRRVQRRMQVLHLQLPDDYIEHLRTDGSEAQALFRELLIGVTEFFRDADAFEALAEQVIGPLIEKQKHSDTLRIWVAGCGSGEEAYSIGMLVLEALDKVERPPSFQLFATDIDERALTAARRGIYDADIAERIGPARLKRFFSKVGRRYQVTKQLREHCLFSLHSLINDPPFSRVDLVSCRNVLIYFGPHLQKKLIPTFHYALRPGGFLFLGASENSSQHSDLFRTVDAKARIAERKPSRIGVVESVDMRTAQSAPSGWHQPNRAEEAELGAISQRIVLDEFAPPYAIADDEGQMIFLSPNLDRYLQPPSGHYANNIIRMTRAGLRAALRGLWLKALKERRRMSRSGVVFEASDGRRSVGLTVQPMPELGHDQGLYMVVFQDQGEAIKDVKGSGASPEAEQHVEQLEAELARTREELERTVQDLEAANEELKSSNEELLSINEELQSANEELETSKEEVQAANTALASANNDLRNLLLSMQIATIFLDAEGRIRSFTPAATELYNIVSRDIGRPFSHFTHRFCELAPMPAISRLKHDHVVEDQARHLDGRWFLRRVVPYDSGTGRFEGTIVSFIDISAQKVAEEAVRESEGRLSKVLENLAAMVGLLELDGTLVEANRTALVPAGLSRADVLGKKFWDTYWWSYDPDVQATLKSAIERAGQGEQVRYDVAVRIADDELMIIDFQISPLRDEDGRITRLVLSAVDVTERKRIEQELSIREARYRTLFEQASVGIAKVAFDGSWIRVNPRICEILGYTSEELLTRRFDDVTYPQDREDGREALQQLKNGEIERYATEKRYVRKDGTIIWCNLSTVRHVDDDGETAFLVSVVEDIDDRKKAEATRELLIDELNHRVRNMLTVVKSIASQTLRHSSSLTEFGDAFEGRVQALATTHTLLSDNKWQGLALRDILEQQLQHASSRAKFDLVGPSVSLKPKPSLALSLVFHELATNAVKYGALAHEGGRIDVSWSLIEGAGLRMLRLLWREIGGKPVEPPTQNGFGSKLIDINISHEFGGKIERDYRSDGLLVTIDLPWRDGDRSGR